MPDVRKYDLEKGFCLRKIALYPLLQQWGYKAAL